VYRRAIKWKQIGFVMLGLICGGGLRDIPWTTLQGVVTQTMSNEPGVVLFDDYHLLSEMADYIWAFWSFCDF
jgi:hypothetical protein